MQALPCIRCNEPLDSVEDASNNQPEKGLSFDTLGHWPSEILDDDGRKIEISLCNPCILASLQSGAAQMIGAER
jgi:hypothetical protein